MNQSINQLLSVKMFMCMINPSFFWNCDVFMVIKFLKLHRDIYA